MTLPDTQVVLAVNGLDREPAYSAAAALSELIEPAADAVSIFEDGEHWRIDAYYCDSTTGEAALEQLRTFDEVAAGLAALSPVVQENWVALSQAALPPVQAGRFTICGSHDLVRVPGGPNTIVVEAGEAFGTAHHATTYGCLLALDRIARQTRYHNVLDLGTGSGVLALALGRALPRAQILASDIDARSIEVANENAERNGLGRLAGGPRFIVADGLGDDRIQRRSPFDLIVANILARPLIAMAPDIVATLGAGATLILSGILVPQAAEVSARFRSLGLGLARHDRHNGWSTLIFKLRDKPRRKGYRRHAEPFNLYMPTYD
ncbi:MAG: 50S ribosomal protein L11 methyltransferase [Hyphomicrobiaceae bacterium]